jgi:hypothetical protein
MKGMLPDAINRAREDVGRIEDPIGQALFETTETLGGSIRAYEAYESRSEDTRRG